MERGVEGLVAEIGSRVKRKRGLQTRLPKALADPVQVHGTAVRDRSAFHNGTLVRTLPVVVPVNSMLHIQGNGLQVQGDAMGRKSHPDPVGGCQLLQKRLQLSPGILETHGKYAPGASIHGGPHSSGNLSGRIAIQD